jgi:hypothetical protein
VGKWKSPCFISKRSPNQGANLYNISIDIYYVLKIPTLETTATDQISVINNGTIPTTLSMSSGDWGPLIAQQYLTITWNYTSGIVLQPGASQTVTITINVNQYVTMGGTSGGYSNSNAYG